MGLYGRPSRELFNEVFASAPLEKCSTLYEGCMGCIHICTTLFSHRGMQKVIDILPHP